MANEVHSPPEPSVTTLVSGIITDVQDLVKQQVALARREIQSDFQKTKEAALSLAWGVGACVLAVILFCLTVVYLLHWLTSPAGSDPASIPLWGCYAIVAGVLAAVGATLTYLGIHKLQSFNPLPDETAEALKENVQWLTNPNRK
jgi:hypothetical protein